MTEIRNALFLYPDIETLKPDEQGTVFGLIKDLKIIANVSNRAIEKILKDNSFAYIRCLPCISVEELHSSNCIDGKEAERVRICVIGYDNTSYENAYVNICKNYNTNKLKISHLVGLKISSTSQGVIFHKSEDSMFDVIIETGLGDLKNILVSIMLDISIYHYFSLSGDLEYRKGFSQLKINCIRDSHNTAQYGHDLSFDEIKYLPFSYPYVKRIDLYGEEVTEVLTSLLQGYFDFITKYVCKQINFSSKKELIDPYTTRENIDTSLLEYITEIIDKGEYCTGHCYYFIIHHEIDISNVDENHLYIIKNDEESMSKWLHKFPKSLTNYSLYFVTIGV